MRTIRYIGKTSYLKIWNSKVGTFLLIFLIYAWSFNQPYLQFVKEQNYPISWCIFPFCMSSYFIVCLYYFGIVYVNSDMPFMQHANMYQVIRCGRKRWVLGQIAGIFVRSFVLTVTSAFIVVLPFIGHLEFTDDWGKVIYTLASTKRMTGFFADNFVEYNFFYDAIKTFTPLELMGITILICTLVFMFLGMAMFMVSLFFGKLWAVAGGFFLSCLLFVVENVPEYERLAVAHFVPLYWVEVALIETPNAGYYRLPSIPYMLTFLVVSIVVMAVLIYWKVKKIEFNWENEDA